MKILVLVKQVPDTEATIRISGDRKKIDEAGVKFIVNPYDEFAIEEALKLKESGAATFIVAVSLGPDRVKEALRTAVAMGVDDVLHLKTADLGMDGLATAQLLSESIKEIGFDLLLMGKEAIDDGNMQVGPMLAELLDVPCLSVVTALQVNGASVVAEREGDGCAEVLEAQLPCMITCQKGLNEPRYPSIRGVMLAKKKEIAEKIVQSANHTVSVESLSYPQARQAGMIVGEGAAAVPELVKKLREEAKVI